ncbi:nicotinate-nucleotide adenylyltransferase [Thalassotalea sp. M1531]|uniref:Probable nicotinate-nucleotide adenylyltransferase n=1 Tax=Thalassotalea algicola TaxID=2716224 RepID=A0A7Y0Q5H9_9GAMM|nr:nicotinate-nucleotide adenylyltransferase [Thalassotalea algicola]NMP31024.1 nicotinate-nucleotide adenylyltransferase [Thalassotalea algicola]
MTGEIKLYFGGTFDPFHNGHLAVAKHVTTSLAIPNITLLPAHIPPHKATPKVSSEHRLAMLNSLASTEPFLSIDCRELNRETPSFTVDTLAEIKRELPQSALNFVIGMDSLVNLHLWHKWQEILTLTNLIVCTRPGIELDAQYSNLNSNVTQYLVNHINLANSGQIYLLPPMNYDISSTLLKTQLANTGLDQITKSHLPAAIAQYISETGLYRN